MTTFHVPCIDNVLFVLLVQWFQADLDAWDDCDEPGFNWRVDVRHLDDFEQQQALSGPLDINFVPPGVVLALVATLLKQVPFTCRHLSPVTCHLSA